MKLVSINKETMENSMVSNEVLAQTIINNTTEMEGMRLASVPVKLLRICSDYQRPIDKAHVMELANPFNRICANCITTSYRDGYFWVIDGQHRVEAAIMSGISSLACIVLTGLTVKEEAKIFKNLNVKQKRPDPYKIFKANICNGDKSDPDVAVDMEIKRICDKYNIDVRKYSRCSEGKALRCLTCAREIIKSTTYNGIKCFEWIIDLINMTDWCDNPSAYTEDIIRVLKNFWVDNYGDAVLEKRLIKAINSTVPELMIARAKHKYDKHSRSSAMNLCLRDMIMETDSSVKIDVAKDRIA